MSRRPEAAPAPKPALKRQHQRPEDFIRAWQTSENAAEAAEKIGITEPNARTRATNYRKRGIPLKRFPGGRFTTEFLGELADLARSLAGAVPDSRTGAEVIGLVVEPPKPVPAPAPRTKPRLPEGRREMIKSRAASASGDFPRAVAKREEDDE